MGSLITLKVCPTHNLQYYIQCIIMYYTVLYMLCTSIIIVTITLNTIGKIVIISVLLFFIYYKL